MSLEDLANLGEFVGAIGVVISLLYLARQIGQNTRQIDQNTETVRLSAYDRFVTAGASARRPIIENPDVARLYEVGLAHPEQLEGLDQTRFRVLMIDIMQSLQVQFAQLGASGFGRDEWQATCRTLRRILSQPGAREFWQTHQSEFPAEFAAEVNRVLGERAA